MLKEIVHFPSRKKGEAEEGWTQEGPAEGASEVAGLKLVFTLLLRRPVGKMKEGRQGPTPCPHETRSEEGQPCLGGRGTRRPVDPPGAPESP